jgi:hypothetical protein
MALDQVFKNLSSRISPSVTECHQRGINVVVPNQFQNDRNLVKWAGFSEHQNIKQTEDHSVWPPHPEPLKLCSFRNMINHFETWRRI